MTTLATTVLPPVALLQEIARERYDAAVAAGCDSDIAGFNKVSTALVTGVLPLFDGHDWFVSSRQGGGEIYRLRRRGGVWSCDCKAGRTGRECWHVRYLGLIDDAWERCAETPEQGHTDPEPAPPVDDGEQDNYGGFRAPRADCHDAVGLIARLGAARHKQALAEMRELYN